MTSYLFYTIQGIEFSDNWDSDDFESEWDREDFEDIEDDNDKFEDVSDDDKSEDANNDDDDKFEDTSDDDDKFEDVSDDESEDASDDDKFEDASDDDKSEDASDDDKSEDASDDDKSEDASDDDKSEDESDDGPPFDLLSFEVITVDQTEDPREYLEKFWDQQDEEQPTQFLGYLEVNLDKPLVVIRLENENCDLVEAFSDRVDLIWWALVKDKENLSQSKPELKDYAYLDLGCKNQDYQLNLTSEEVHQVIRKFHSEKSPPPPVRNNKQMISEEYESGDETN